MSQEPTVCPQCKGDQLVTHIKAIDHGVASEYSVECRTCGIEIGYYAYGAWDPNYFRELNT